MSSQMFLLLINLERKVLSEKMQQMMHEIIVVLRTVVANYVFLKVNQIPLFPMFYFRLQNIALPMQ